MKNEEIIRLHFEGSEGILLKTLIESLDSTLVSLNAIAKTTLSEKDEYSFRVKPFQAGSFTVEIIVLMAAIVELIPHAISLGKVLVDMVRIKKHLKGEDPKGIIININENHVQITNKDEGVIIVGVDAINAFSKTKTVDQGISSAFRAMEKDPSRNDFEITVSGETGDISERITKNEMKGMTKASEIDKFISTSETKTNMIWLQVGQVDFRGKDIWRFIGLDGKEVKAKIADEEFLRELYGNQIMFDADTKLLVNMEITITTSENGKKEKVEYIIRKVLKVENHPKGTQMSIDLKND